MADALKRGDKGPDVFSWQRFLKSKGLYGGPINGDFDYDTERATNAYQGRNSLATDGIVVGATLQRARWDGFVPATEDRNRGEYRTEHDVELSFDARRFLEKVAPDFYDRTGHNLTVTSCIRSPRKQARAMFDNLERNQHTPYRDHRAYNEIREAYDIARHSGASEQQTVEAMTHVIEEQIAPHDFISNHLAGEAVDLRKPANWEEQRALNEAIDATHGARSLDEHNHFHVELR